MKGKLFIIKLSMLIFWGTITVRGQEAGIIPRPAQQVPHSGYFILSSETRLVVDTPDQEVLFLQDMVKGYLGQNLSEKGKGNCILINLSPEITAEEGYAITISKDTIHITARTATGIFYAIQTLQQLCSSAKAGQGKLLIPQGKIIDYPAYGWRGLMIDVSRHFFTLEYLKRQVDILSYYKMNKLHLHLTDDQGWRIEIKKYPELTQKGAWRTFNSQDSACMKETGNDPDLAIDPRLIIHTVNGPLYGGYYTQDELKELIKYASARHVEIIPEIDMPGHMSAAISAYPDLACTGRSGWGETFSTPLCPCNETVFVFLKNVLDEVITLFPSEYVHLGADEVEKATWESSDACKALMKEKGYSTVAQLQTYFVEKLQQYLSSKGKKLIAWDEVLEGGINKDVNVMYWRDWAGGVPQAVVANGNQIIFTPGTPLYFSRQDSTLFPIYNGVPKAMNEVGEHKQLIKGAQANLWTERIPTERRSDYLVYPRLLALSEITWTSSSNLNWESFKRRLQPQFDFLDQKGIKHTTLAYTLIPEISIEKNNVNVRFETEQVTPDIHYTLDGSLPTPHSLKYKDDGINIADSASICAAIYTADGKMQEPVLRRRVDLHKAINRPVIYRSKWNKAYPASKEKALTDGLQGGEDYNDGIWQGFTEDVNITIDLGKEVPVSYFSANFMQVTGPGIYMPAYVEVRTSRDNKKYDKVLTIHNDIPETQKEKVVKQFSGKLNTEKKVRYVNVQAKVRAKSFLFTDEIIIYQGCQP